MDELSSRWIRFEAGNVFRVRINKTHPRNDDNKIRKFIREELCTHISAFLKGNDFL